MPARRLKNCLTELPLDIIGLGAKNLHLRSDFVHAVDRGIEFATEGFHDAIHPAIGSLDPRSLP